MLSEKTIGPGGWPYYCHGVMVGDGHRPAGMPLRAAQDEAGVPPGFWTGRGLAAVGLASCKAGNRSCSSPGSARQTHNNDPDGSGQHPQRASSETTPTCG
ncbi:hypothetical protein [Streptomyces sp. NPDC056468]|uniref:hypothetical protein n=1 Tax=Streptomyces sp. NPDC056468 TaxID=3345830 RepID=UPI00369DC9D5